ncbi:MAG TPA: agmatine deiminase family protein [Tepidisphaeraceae bacterium]
MEYGYVSACPPGDFEQQAALLVSLTELLQYSPQTVLELAEALIDRIPLIAIIRDEDQRRHAITMLTDWGLPAQGIYFVFMPVGTWTRDFAPAFVRWHDGTVRIVDAEYRFEGRPNEDVVPRALAGLLKLPRRGVPLVLEGGNLLSNGRGLCLTTDALVDVNNLNGRRYDAIQIRQILDECYGFSQTVMLEPLMGYRTLHVDMFAAFTAADVVVVGQCDAQIDPKNAAVLDRNAQILTKVRTGGGRLRVERIPMPPYDGNGVRTYTNVIFANGTLLVPHYPDVDPAIEERAMDVYAELLPDWELLRIDCGPLVPGGGSLRCLSAHVPWLHEHFRERPGRARRQTLRPELRR